MKLSVLHINLYVSVLYVSLFLSSCSELNDVDVSNASTVVKPHTYRELERHTGPIPPPPHFALSTGSAMSLSSHQGRPLPPNTSVSGPVQGGAASIQRILEPGAHSMHFPRTSATFAQGREIRGGSLHGTRVGANYRPPIPPGMQPQHSEIGRRGSVPLKIWRQSHQQQHQILLPGKSMPVLSSTPVPSPPTPQMTDPPVPYLTPERPWYNSDYELTNNPVSHSVQSVYRCCACKLIMCCLSYYIISRWQCITITVRCACM